VDFLLALVLGWSVFDAGLFLLRIWVSPVFSAVGLLSPALDSGDMSCGNKSPPVVALGVWGTRGESGDGWVSVELSRTGVLRSVGSIT
jgi:hypothetical protein